MYNVIISKTAQISNLIWKDCNRFELIDRQSVLDLRNFMNEKMANAYFFDDKVKIEGWNIMTFKVPKKCTDCNQLFEWLKNRVEKTNKH